MRTSKIPICTFVTELGKIWKYCLGLCYKKKTIFHLLLELGKNKREKLGTLALDQHTKIVILKLWMNWEKLHPNLSFKVENRLVIYIK